MDRRKSAKFLCADDERLAALVLDRAKKRGRPLSTQNLVELVQALIDRKRMGVRMPAPWGSPSHDEDIRSALAQRRWSYSPAADDDAVWEKAKQEMETAGFSPKEIDFQRKHWNVALKSTRLPSLPTRATYIKIALEIIAELG